MTAVNAQNAWAWYDIDNSLQLPQAINAINDRMKRLQNAPGMLELSFQVKETKRTTDATVTTIETIPCPVMTTLGVVGYVVARRTGGAAGAAGDGAIYRVEFAAKNEAGTAAQIAAPVVTTLGESQAGWDVTVSFSGGNALVRVTGAANNAITWKWARRLLPVAS